jgi:hypothetical protein
VVAKVKMDTFEGVSSRAPIALMAALCNSDCLVPSPGPADSPIEPDWSSTRAILRPHCLMPPGSMSEVASWLLNWQLFVVEVEPGALQA